MKLRERGEEGVVSRLVEIISRGWRCPRLKPGDDASCIEVGGRTLLLNIDGYSFASSMLPWMTWRDLGWKTVVAAASDLIAKGGRPLAFLVSIGVEPEQDERVVYEIVAGAQEAAEAMGAWLAGGDTNAAVKDGWIDVAGVAEARRIIGMEGGDYIALYTTIGRYGLTGLAFHILERGALEELEKYPKAVRATTRPEPRLKVLELYERLPDGCVVAASDVSDGLLATLERMAKLMGVPVCLERLPPPHGEAVLYAHRVGIDVSELIVRGGEEYEIVIGVKRACITEIEKEASRLGILLTYIGCAGSECCISCTHTMGGTIRPKLYLKVKLPIAYTRWDQFRRWA